MGFCQVELTDEQRRFAWSLANSKAFVPRGRKDGNVNERYLGMLGEVAYADIARLPRPTGYGNPDDGYDIIAGGKKVDIKTSASAGFPRRKYVRWVYAEQAEAKRADVYLFLALRKDIGILYVIGWITADDFLARARFLPKGAIKVRRDGSTWPSPCDQYEIPGYCLNTWESHAAFADTLAMT